MFRTALSISLLLSLFLQAGCGFQPVHGRRQHSVSTPAIEIAPIGLGRAGQILYTELTESLAGSNPAYRLHVDLKKQQQPVVVQQDRSITRYNEIFTGNFMLRDIRTNEVIMNDAIIVRGSYDAAESDFSTFSAEQQTSAWAMQEMAKRLELRISTKLRSLK